MKNLYINYLVIDVDDGVIVIENNGTLQFYNLNSLIIDEII